ncbi:MAG TPA: hypothetical protein VII86_02915, partial [Thermoanaerobaculia bacterium]
MSKVWFLTLALLVCARPGGAAAPPAGPSTSGGDLRYTVFLGNVRVGAATLHAGPDGEAVVNLKLSDRGRGQDLTSQLRLDPAGVPLQEHLTGVDYWRNPVDERFELAGGKAAWSGGTDKGEKKVSAPAFYITRDGSYIEIGLLAMALLQSPGHKLPLLPEGEARIESVATAKAEAGGKTREVSLYALYGITAVPLYVWMDNPRLFFGRYDGWTTVVPEGWEEAMPALLKVQAQAMAARERALAAKLSHRPARALAIQGARLFDPETRTVRPHTTVVVSGNRIQAVGPDGEVPVPPGAEVVEAQGKTLLPGLWDMHQH